MSVDPADPRRQAWQVFIETGVRLQTLLDEDLKANAGMSLADYQVLLLLHDAPGGRLRMREIADALVFSTSRLSYQIDVLARRGWLCRERAAEDGRGSYAVLTAAGRDVFRAAARHHCRSVDRLFTEALTAADGPVLRDIMVRLDAHLRGADRRT